MTGCRDPGQIVVGVGAVIRNDRGAVLLVRRSNAPRAGEWSLPGGKVEYGETLRAALVREIREETGLEIEALDLIDVAEIGCDSEAGTQDKQYVLVDFRARVVGGVLVAGSDAADARWFAEDEIDRLEIWSETRRVIESASASTSMNG
ncbi:MAG TPA: NUDIX hydrolase [Rhizomicrobium sp.]